MKVIVAGSRGICDYYTVCDAISFSAFGVREIVSGGARGVDELGERYARANNIELTVFPADWRKHGKRAGYLRNQQMGEYADALIAVWDGESKGTKHMIDIMRKLGKPVEVVDGH